MFLMKMYFESFMILDEHCFVSNTCNYEFNKNITATHEIKTKFIEWGITFSTKSKCKYLDMNFIVL